MFTLQYQSYSEDMPEMQSYDEMVDELDEDKKLDKHALDVEWENQSDLYEKWSRLWANAVFIRDIIWQTRKEITAELLLDIRIQLTRDKKKDTDKIVDAMLRDCDHHKQVSVDLIQANYQVNLFSGAKWAMAHKKDSLENEVTLWCNNYYADNINIPSVVQQKINEKENKETRAGLQRRKP